MKGFFRTMFGYPSIFCYMIILFACFLQDIYPHGQNPFCPQDLQLLLESETSEIKYVGHLLHVRDFGSGNKAIHMLPWA